MDRDYTDRKKLLKGMRRIQKKRIPILDGRGGALPPINAPTTNSTDQGRSNELANSTSPRPSRPERAYTQDGEDKRDDTMTSGDPTSEDATPLDVLSKSSKANQKSARTNSIYKNKSYKSISIVDHQEQMNQQSGAQTQRSKLQPNIDNR